VRFPSNEAAYRRNYQRRLREDGPQAKPVACRTCGAKDGRDKAHAQGCPRLAPLSRAELIAIARNVEEAWARRAPKAKAAGAAA